MFSLIELRCYVLVCILGWSNVILYWFRYQALRKEYSGAIRLGEATPSYDADTEVSERLPWEHITDEQLEQAAITFVGDIQQRPPAYSALSVYIWLSVKITLMPDWRSNTCTWLSILPWCTSTLAKLFRKRMGRLQLLTAWLSSSEDLREAV